MAKRLQAMVDSKLDQWGREAEMAFARFGKQGVKMHRELWANGQVMVGWEGARANQYVPLDRAIEIWRNGWKLQPDVIKAREQRFEAADMATASLVVKKAFKGEGRYAVVAYLPAGIQDFPEVIGVSTEKADIEKFWAMGADWIAKLGFVKA